MTESTSYADEECFNVYWKIKNFSYCGEEIQSFNCPYRIHLKLRSVDLDCRLSGWSWGGGPNIQISFLTCDGSPEESISGDARVSLQVPKDVIFQKRRNSFLPEDTLTILLRVVTDHKGTAFIYSQIGVKRNYFLWTFKDFSKFEKNVQILAEESVGCGSITLHFKPMGVNNLPEQYTIEITRSGGEMCYCMLKIYVLDVNGKALNEVSSEFAFDKDVCQTKGFPLIIKKRKLLAYKNLLLPNDTLTLKCDFAVSLGKVSDQTTFTYYCEDVTPLLKEQGDLSMTFKKRNDRGCVTELQTDLKRILENGILHDVSLHVGSDVTQAHKSILSARSAVFMTMFTKDMKEVINNTVVIEDLDYSTVLRLLLYMYTDTIPDYEWDSVKNLYYAAKKYEVSSLKEKCVSFLKRHLSVSNVCEALVLADLHQDANLKTAVIDFISECESEVFASEEWKQLEENNSPLALKVMREICRKIRIRLN